MFVCMIVLCALCLYKIKFSAFREDYMGPEQTTAVKGIFAVFILMSHMSSNLQFDARVDTLTRGIIAMIGQLMVTMFFFYSGYGILEGYRKKANYAHGFLKNRFLKVLLHFDLALVLFALMGLILGNRYTATDYLFCWFGWTGIGNSNWFIFDTLVFYLIVYAAMGICHKFSKNQTLFCLIATVLCAVFWFILYRVKGPESWWYNTIFCFPMGLWYSAYQERINKLCRKPVLWGIGLVLTAVVFYVLYSSGNEVLYTLCSALFCVVLAMITMRVRICNPVLTWLGVNSFSIYILQRLPMMLFSKLGLQSHPYLYVLLVVAVTLPISAAFTWLLRKVDRVCFPSKKASV